MNKMIAGLMLLASVGLSACATTDASKVGDANTAESTENRKAWMDNDRQQTGSRLPSHGGHAVNSTSGADYQNATQGQASPTRLQ
ncbi:hypothetical protein [Rugamonas sp.]|uniref:hypothetical protein n=1 Tax=Rugamonas sp. TaxID=1926287 RepID=UPI0025F08B3D|nr:hypothetical protein [Rugamonas sp.]